MGLKKAVWLGIVVIVVMSCSAPKVMFSYKTDAGNHETSGNYIEATEAWKQYFNTLAIEEIPGADFANAAKTAYKSGNTDLALSWFDQARYKNYADFEMYRTLAKVFKQKQNISKELSALEYIVENYSEQTILIDDRLFDVYFEIESTDNALQVWERLDETQKNEQTKLNSYFQIQKAHNDSVICDSVSLLILEKDAEHIDALEWNAKKLYWLGENRYQKEMAKYNKKKTSRQYKVLLKELEIATTDFKKSLVYFEKLWKKSPGEKYAGYFANIYARFGDEKKSQSYKQYMQ